LLVFLSFCIILLMIKVIITNEILDSLLRIEANRTKLSVAHIPLQLENRLRKSSKKKSSYASNKIEGNPLNYEQAEEAIDSHRHLLSPEQEIKNYFLALNLLEQKLKKHEPISLQLILETQALVVNGASKEKTGIRGPMPAGVLFAVYDDKSGKVDYIPPESKDIPPLLEELVSYLNTSADHPIIKAAIAHYQLVTIHPFEDGNGRTARLLSDYVLSYYGYDFDNLGSLEEYFAFDIDEYYSSLQMGLPPVYYDGRDNPPHPEIWVGYFLRMMELYSSKVILSVTGEVTQAAQASLSYLSKKEKDFLFYLNKNKIIVFKPVDLAKAFKVSARTIANWSAALSQNGFLKPNLIKKRITSYALTDLALSVKKETD
jgi:Fic family protein